MGGRTVAAGSVVTNPLAKMCETEEDHARHIWADGEWFCFGGPFTDTQQQIKHKRYLKEDP